MGRPADNGIIGHVDPQCRLICLHIYSGLLKIIPIDSHGKLDSKAFNIRYRPIRKSPKLDLGSKHAQITYESTAQGSIECGFPRF